MTKKGHGLSCPSTKHSTIHCVTCTGAHYTQAHLTLITAFKVRVGFFTETVQQIDAPTAPLKKKLFENLVVLV